MVLKELKSDLSGPTKWIFLFMIGGYIPLILMSRVNTVFTIIGTLLYFFILIILCVIEWYKIFQLASSVHLLRANIKTSPLTEELDVNLLISHHIDLDINRKIPIENYDDYYTYAEHIIDKISEITKKKIDLLEEQIKLEEIVNVDDNDEKINTDLTRTINIKSNTLKDWLKNELQDPDNTEISDIHVSYVKIIEGVFLDSMPDIEFEKCVIITDSKLLDEFDFQLREEIIRNYFINCKSSRAELLQIGHINSDIPIFLTLFSPSKSKKITTNVLESSTIDNITNRVMRFIISSQRNELSSYYKLKSEHEEKLQVEKYNTDYWKGQAFKYSRKPITDILTNDTPKRVNSISVNKFLVGLGVLGFIIIFLALILVFK